MKRRCCFYPNTAAEPPQLQFGFFQKAVPFLESIGDDELRRHVDRYAAFLTELAGNAGGSAPAPSFATELVWRTHLLMPLRYRKDCAKLGASETIDHEVLPADHYRHGGESCCPLASESHKDCDKEFHFLVGAVRRQQGFMTKMLGQRSSFDLAHCVQNYVRFLGLMKKNEGAALVPTLAIDLAWHTHQMLPRRYAAECRALAGRFVNHDDNLEDGQLSADMAQTEKLWYEAYKVPYLTRTNTLRTKAGQGGLAIVLLASCAVLASAPHQQALLPAVSAVSARRQMQLGVCGNGQYHVSYFENVYYLDSATADPTITAETTIDCER